MEDQAEYIIPITDINITLKHYLWNFLLIIELPVFFVCFFCLVFLSLLLSQYREMPKSIFEEAGKYPYFFLTFLVNEEK